MVAITLRADLTRGLTNEEIDANMTNLKTAVEAAALSAAWASLTGKPTTLSGYGITDAQSALVSGTNIKTVNGTSVLGSGNIQIDGGVSSFNTRTGAVELTAADANAALLNADVVVNGIRVGRGPRNRGDDTVFGKNAYTFSGGGGGGEGCAFGNFSLYSNRGALLNSGFGASSLGANEFGERNSAFGAYALSGSVNLNNCTGLGFNTVCTGDNQVQLGDSDTTTYVYGTVQNRSDLRDKADVRDTILGLDFINALRPVDYRLDMREDYRPERPAGLPEDATDQQKATHAAAMVAYIEACKHENLTHNGTKKRLRYHHGLIAQEVKAVIDAQGIDFGGYQDHKLQGGEDVLSIGYDELIAPLIKAVQELTAQNVALAARVTALEAA